ncbi:hypothetical protein DFH11DRAFT_1721981 [Phellopilus nigrolimitatus]|nr:hypothetical protein DFH11DRAFT_1721981 [Phellopilus nigrolimitatus]
MSGRLHARMSSDHDHGSRRSRVSTESTSSSSPRESIPPPPVKPPPRKVDPRLAGGTAEEYLRDFDNDNFSFMSPPATESPLDTPLRGTLERRKTSSHGRSSRRSRDHSSRGHSSSARDLIRLLVNERDSKEAMTILHKTAERLELETQRANDAERRLQDAEDRWKMINQSRMQAQSDVARINEELRLYKLQLEAAQSQIARANDMIAQTDREKALAEDQAAKAKRQARKLEIETMVQKALDEGRKLGREQGMREGREQGYNAAVDDAYVRARVETNRRLDDFLQNELGPEFGIDDPYGDDELDDDEFLPQPGPSSAPGMPAPGMQMFEPQRRMPEPQRQMREPQRQMREPQRQMREPQRQVDESERQMHDSERQMHEPRRRRSMHDSRQAGPSILDQSNSMANAPRSRRSHSTGLFGTIKRSIGRVGPRNADRNVEINHGAPDAGTIVEDATLYNLSSPLPSSATAQFSRARAPSPVPMPQPNFHPNPSEVPPISMMNRQQSPMHAPVEIPPEGYIPPIENGSILLPPPHELARAPPTPSQGNSPLLTNPSLSRGNPGPAPPPKEPVPRDFVYENPQRSSRHRYQRSVAESVASTNTSNLSIISPPGPVRSSAMQTRLSAIPEYDGRHSSPSGSMHQGDGSGFAPPGRSLSRTSMSRHGETDALGMNGVYQTASPGMVDESIYRRSDRRNADSNGPVLPGDITATFSPQSYRSGFSGPRRPSHVTTPAPLAPQAYSRPRINSGASDAGFDARSSRGRGSVAGSEYRSRPNTASNSVVGNLPEINIEPPV